MRRDLRRLAALTVLFGVCLPSAMGVTPPSGDRLLDASIEIDPKVIEADTSLMERSFSPVTDKSLTHFDLPVEGSNDDALVRESSFPARILRAGAGDDAMPWSRLPRGWDQFTPLRLTLDVRGCSIEIASSPMQLGVLEVADQSVQYRRDALPPRSDLVLENPNRLMFVASTEVLLRTARPNGGECLGRTGEGPIFLGRVSLAPTRLRFSQGRTQESPPPWVTRVATWSESNSVPLYLEWPVGWSRPMLRDEDGPLPNVRSPLFWIPSDAPLGTGYFLGVSPAWAFEPGPGVRLVTGSFLVKRSGP